MSGALILGTLLAVGALAYVLYPLFFGMPTVRVVRAAAREAEGDSPIVALREIEFDRATGKLSDADYAALKTRYTREALAVMRQTESGGQAAEPSDDEIEAAVRAYRERHASCPTCGPRPESDALFCSTCGRYLRDRCADCGAPVDALDARYCVSCGKSLAA